jgi:hypothetical protein
MQAISQLKGGHSSGCKNEGYGSVENIQMITHQQERTRLGEVFQTLNVYMYQQLEQCNNDPSKRSLRKGPLIVAGSRGIQPFGHQFVLQVIHG